MYFIINLQLKSREAIMNKKGFTLLELMVVLIILGVLVSLGMPQYMAAVEKSRTAEAVGILGAIRGAELRYFSAHGTYAPDCAVLQGTESCGLDVSVGTLKFFEPPAVAFVNNDSQAFATIRRLPGGNLGQYTLMIDAAGDITCDDGHDPMNPGPLCRSLGY